MIDTEEFLDDIDELEDILSELNGDDADLSMAKNVLSNLRSDVEMLEREDTDGASDFEGFMTSVIDSIPRSASMKFRMDVEEALEGLRSSL